MYIVTADNGVKYFKSSFLLSPHGFSTRIGGESKFPHTKALNLAFGRGDDRETVLRNLTLFAEAVGITPQSIVSVPQIHSNKIMRLTVSDIGMGYYKGATCSLDGYVTKDAGVSPAIKTADCVPILFEARKNGKICGVGAAHAGWRGTALNIAAECAKNLCKISGVAPSEIFVAIGPAIGPCCFETDYNVKYEFSKILSEQALNKYICYNQSTDKYFPDLKSINAYLLENIGVLRENIDICELCTCCHPELFYSHRLTNGNRGTMLSVIGC